MAESLAYGPNGSGYDLGLTDRVEVKRLSLANEVIPTWPIVDLNTVVAEYRSARIDNEWQAIESASLEISPNRVRVKDFAGIQHPSRDFGRRRFWQNRPLYGQADNELRLTYQSGIDFTSNTPEVQRLRAALGGIVTAQYAAARGISQLTEDNCNNTTSGQKLIEKSALNGMASVKYSDPDKAAATSAQLLQIGSSNGSINGTIEDCLAVFRQYQVRPIVG
jgi:hypothetical protein